MAEATDRQQHFQGDGHIHIQEVEELRHWTKELGISSDALISAVRAVGNDVSKVQEYLKSHKPAAA